MKCLLPFVRCILVLLGVAGLCACGGEIPYVTLRGNALGTTYQLTYCPEASLLQRPREQETVARTLAHCIDLVNQSLSVYNNHSLISRLNRNETLQTDSLFDAVFLRAAQLTRLTQGAFDIAASPLFEAWGFGAAGRDPAQEGGPTPAQIDSLKAFCGMDKVALKGGQLLKQDPRVTLNMNAIAKGFTCDLVARALTLLGLSHFLIEIGGEIVCRGEGPRGGPWRIGIDKPFDGNYTGGQALQEVVPLQNRAMATSGNYRNFYYRNGQKVGHTIHPKTGYPVQQEVLSATVLAPDAMTADALATAFMVMGLERSKALLVQHPEWDAVLIYWPEAEPYAGSSVAAAPIEAAAPLAVFSTLP